MGCEKVKKVNGHLTYAYANVLCDNIIGTIGSPSRCL